MNAAEKDVGGVEAYGLRREPGEVIDFFLWFLTIDIAQDDGRL